MGHISKTPAGSYRANWRDWAGRQKAKTFKTRREAGAFLADIESALNRGAYVDPYAGRTRFGTYAVRWLAARNSQATTAARDRSFMRTHVLPRWAAVPLGKVDHLAVQEWVTELSGRLAPATVATCYQLTSAVFKAAVRDRLIGFNPCEGVSLPRIRRRDISGQIVSPGEVTDRLLPVVPLRYRALVGLAAGTGLRWGECVGLRWDAVDLGEGKVRVVRVAVEVAGTVTSRPFPKSRAGNRSVPLPPFVSQLLTVHREQYPPGSGGEIFTNIAGGPLRRTSFRKRVWRPALVRAGMLGSVKESSPETWRATWLDASGLERNKEFTTERDAVACVAAHASGGLHFHGLRHSYATWLISSGVPVNDVQRVVGHEQASTTLNRYTHGSSEQDARVRKALADFSLTPGAPEGQEDEGGPS
ncbi:MAG: tyrosine-type recombinase/integrase [Carbonactinosporaceae bacterium]